MQNTYKKINEKTVYLIDGSSFLYRAYYSLRPLHTPTDIPVQAVYSFCRMIKKLVDTHDAKYISVVWDSKGKTERHEEYKEYKAKRQKPPQDLFNQKDYIIEFLDVIGIKQYAQTGIEADDIIYSLAKDLQQEDIKVVVVSSDKDLQQMLTLPYINIFDPYKDSLIDKQKAEKKMGIPVSKFPFYFALIGDSSDNIPGVKGVGAKTALTIVNQFDSLDDLYDNINKIDKARTRRLLLEDKDNAFMSLDLFTLRYHQFNLLINELQFDEQNWSLAIPLFKKLNFKSFLKGVSADNKENKTSYEKKKAYWEKFAFMCITKEKELKELCNLLEEKKLASWDTETDGLNWLQCNPIGISCALNDKEVYYIPFGHKTKEKQLSIEIVTKYLKPILEDDNHKKIMHHAKFDFHIFARMNIIVKGLFCDTMIAARLLSPEWQKIGLKDLSETYFQEDMVNCKELFHYEKVSDFSYIDLKIATLYSGADARQTFKLYTLLYKKLEKESLLSLYNNIDQKAIYILFNMEEKGIIFDVDKAHQIGKKVTKSIHEVESEINSIAGILPGSLNLNSPRQVEHLLFNTLKLPPQKKSSQGKNYSTSAEVLTQLKNMHPIVPLIIKYRELAKLKSTYLNALPDYVDKKTKRIHTHFSQTLVATGRLSSSNPNLQNIPASGIGLSVRSAFIPEKMHCFISADYSQIELRILAHLSQDQHLIQAFQDGHDIHKETAARIFEEKSLDNITSEQRQIGKRINFSILYGLTPYGLSQDLGISFADAKLYIKKYFEMYPAILPWMESIIAFAKKHGYVETIYKRRRYIPHIYEKNKTLYDEACRVAVNTIAQGTAADLVKLGMIQLYETLNKNNYNSFILLQIHDELLISVKNEEKETIEQVVKKTLESIIQWKIPLTVTIRKGNNWEEVTK